MAAETVSRSAAWTVLRIVPVAGLWTGKRFDESVEEKRYVEISGRDLVMVAAFSAIVVGWVMVLIC